MLSPFLVGLYVFLLAIFVGRELLTKVPHTLHTPLMSGANAISGITIVGALIVAGQNPPDKSLLAGILGLLAVAFAMINVAGGFAVTHRMLEMFQKKG